MKRPIETGGRRFLSLACWPMPLFHAAAMVALAARRRS